MKSIYENNSVNTERYALGRYKTKPMIVFGINPSTATKEKNDTTISIIEQLGTNSDFAKENDMDGFIMFNLYPLRATLLDEKYPEESDAETVKANLQIIEKYITKGTTLVAAWGAHITDRMYFIDMLRAINAIAKQKGANWVSLCKTKYGHPHHPTRLKFTEMTYEKFDMDEYLLGLMHMKSYIKYNDSHPMLLLPDFDIKYLKPTIISERYGRINYLSGKSELENTLTAISKLSDKLYSQEKTEYIAFDDRDSFIKKLIELNETSCTYVNIASKDGAANIINRIKQNIKPALGTSVRRYYIDNLEKAGLIKAELQLLEELAVTNNISLVFLTVHPSSCM